MEIFSFWWIFAAFVGGGFAGMLVMALMCMTASMPRQSSHAPDLRNQAF
jgi:hypothetical protein